MRKRNTITEKMPSMPATSRSSCFTVSSIRVSTRTAKARVNTNMPTIARMTLSRSSVVAMMRGVYWPPATWIATSSEPKVKTMNERLRVMKSSSWTFAPVTERPRKDTDSEAQPRSTSQVPNALTARWNSA